MDDVLDGEVAALRNEVRWMGRELERLSMREHGMTAEETMAKARAFIALNPGIWEDVRRAAVQAARCGRPFSMRDELRKHAARAFGDGEHGVVNAITPALTRIMCTEVPELRHSVRLNRSKVDRFFPELFEER